MRLKMMLLAIWPTTTPSASAACCAVRAASLNSSGVCGCACACRAAATRCTPADMGFNGSLISLISTLALVEQRLAGARLRCAAQKVADELARVNQLVQINAGLNAHAVQQIDHIFRCHIAGRTPGVGATPQPRHRSVKLPNPHLQTGQNI